MREGWSRLNLTQRMLFGFWFPNLIAVSFLGDLACFFLGLGWLSALLLVVSVVGPISLVMTIRDGASNWPGPLG